MMAGICHTDAVRMTEAETDGRAAYLSGRVHLGVVPGRPIHEVDADRRILCLGLLESDMNAVTVRRVLDGDNRELS